MRNCEQAAHELGKRIFVLYIFLHRGYNPRQAKGSATLPKIALPYAVDQWVGHLCVQRSPSPQDTPCSLQMGPSSNCDRTPGLNPGCTGTEIPLAPNRFKDYT